MSLAKDSVNAARIVDLQTAVIAHDPVASCAARKCTVGLGVVETFTLRGGANLSAVDCKVRATPGLGVSD